MEDMVQANALLNEQSEMDGKYLTYFTQNQLYGIPICNVVQIVGMQEITEIPEYPPYAKGIINLRGAIIPLIDIRLRFKKPEKDYDERTCIIVTLINDESIGIIVDAVDSVTPIDAENISEPPKISTDEVNSYLTGIARHDGRVVLLLDIDRIMNEERLHVTI